ncbi:ATP-binding protein [Acuticoccus yangtzensis]|uniref:ATP-binding protein n=1 Tax=Acuticoccus yangtzensis TaxID=1443441 RepID=UPI0009495B46|nr:ATP-binding protein [Acuticoccus yangtzensis]ORE92137.1 ATPase, histidine kinase-, DNA gyrase B-, and HSP90-like domain-containing protein [Stappia sp. 22II-S9-Z10]
MTLWPKSLSARLLLTSFAWALFALVATGLVLVSAFRTTVEARFDDTLGVYLAMLVAQLSEAQDDRYGGIPPDLGEPRFVLPLSGWYWMVMDADDGEVMQTSESLAGDVIDLSPDFIRSVGFTLRQSYARGPAGDPLRLVSRRVAFADGRWVLVVVSGEAATIADDTAAFGTRLALYLGLFAVVLVAVTFIHWRISLRPLTALGAELQAVREGKVRHVSTKFPTEIAPVADALNTLIDANQATLERARRHVGNLAHALKTPLSVLLNDAAGTSEPLARSVREQVNTMQRQVRYYLDRAQMAAQDRFVATTTDVGPVIDRMHRAMSRLGEARGLELTLERPDGLQFAGEQQDFEEIVGNLVDNGMKWADTTVAIRVMPSGEVLPGSAFKRAFTVAIEDDGPGLTEAERAEVVSRGKRLDQTKPGSGLGLSIVSELVELYGGRLELGAADLGGLKVTVVLPRA